MPQCNQGCAAPLARISDRALRSLPLLGGVDREAADDRGAAEAAKAGHDAAVRLLALLRHLRVPLVAVVAGDREDCDRHDHPRNTTSDRCTNVLVWIRHINPSLVTDGLAYGGDVRLLLVNATEHIVLQTDCACEKKGRKHHTKSHCFVK